jgi:BolA protein
MRSDDADRVAFEKIGKRSRAQLGSGHRSAASMSCSSTMTDMVTHIEATLREKLAASEVEVVDDSQRHRKHASSGGAKSKHFKVRVVSPLFEGKSLVQRHRMVNALFADEMKRAIHSLALDTRAPGE